METPSLPWCGILWGVQEAGYPAQCRTALTGGLLTRTPSYYPGPQPLCNLPPHPRPGVGRTVPGGLGRAQRKEPVTQLQEERQAGQAGLAGAGGATATNCPPACRRWVGAWVGFRFRRGCDCEARKLRESSD